MTHLFRVFIPTSIVGLVISEVLVVFVLFTAAIAVQGTISWQADHTYLIFFLTQEGGLASVTIVTGVLIFGLYLNDCYTRLRMRSRTVFLQQLCLVIGVAFLLQALFSYARMDIRMPRQSMLLGSIFCMFLLPAWRTAYGKVSLMVLGAERLLFVGTHPLQMKLAQFLIDHPEFAMQTAGFIPEAELGSLESYLRSHRVDRMIVGLKEEDPRALLEIARLPATGARTESLTDLHEQVFGRVAIAQLNPLQILFRKGLVPAGYRLQLQLIYSWAIAAIAVILLLPVILATAIAVRISSPGPVLFRQVRTGRNNKPFTLFKFRSMRQDAEAATGAVWAQENDPRVTKLGKLLRKYRLDELPQLFNVLRCEMAIVGPRPERPEFVNVLAEKIPFYNHRHTVRPGITGWAQINYRYGNTIEDTVFKLEYDLYYIKHFAPSLDFYVMFHTAKTMLLTRGAY
ncbi:MAG: sugar transferase [Candidatus Solibacter usitatus]|nr:sugar transferase [Candidatus Solibacter usitatus]